MRIAILAAGAAGMYCGACARDIALARGLLSLGHEARVVPLYTPLRTEGEEGLAFAPLHYGGLNVYLEQAGSLLAKLPRALRRWLDSPALLKLAGGRALETRPSELGEMTVSVLAGRAGRQRQEAESLVRFLQNAPRPEVIHLSNSLLSGVAPLLKEALPVPLVCTLQGEDDFVRRMGEPYTGQALEILRENAAFIDAFVAPGQHYAEEMRRWLRIEPERMHVVRAGILVEHYPAVDERRRDPFTIGCVGGLTPRKGQDLLVEAVATLLGEKREVRLVLAGKTLDAAFEKSLRASIRKRGIDEHVDLLGELTREEKSAVLGELSVFCQPSRFDESRGTAAMEAMARGIPVTVPARGVFPELLGLAEGGLLYKPDDPAALAAALRRIMDDPKEADWLGRRAAQRIRTKYTAARMAEKTCDLYEELIWGG